MKNLTLFSAFVFLAFIFSGCPFIKTNPKYTEGVFPDYPVNFVEINSEYDDYNSMLPVVQYDQYIYFSSNRNSGGQNFDIVGDNLHIWWDMETGLLTVDNSKPYYDLSYTDTLLDMINTSANEFGPYALSYWTPYNVDDYARYDIVTYSSNFDSDDYTSKFVYFKSDGNGVGSYHGPFDINLINTSIDAQYSSFFTEEENFYYGETDPAKFRQMIFNLNLDGRTGIYSIDLPANDDFIDMLKNDTVISPSMIHAINSDDEDKCPFVNNQFLVFSSNREGGLGGYDLYYSRYENGNWTAPVNFGEGINSAFDEFRPVTIVVPGFINDLMIYSSNRPGGEGGYDLYYVGLPFKITNLLYSD
ncbi:MAG: hypothetical protein QM503_09545 [Bacteroidota bacterium]